ncbi:MAG TPA: Dabb family protein [Planctomycetota bacterium]|nr:Dabb family protein [Planctomycetota bacterium]
MKQTLLIAAALTVAVSLAFAAAPSKAPAGALRHVVLFKFKDDAKPEQIQQVETEFKALKGKISEVQGLEWGTNVSPENLAQGFTHCFFVSFADAKGRDAYLTHAAHQDFVKILKPVLDKVLVVDYVSQE